MHQSNTAVRFRPKTVATKRRLQRLCIPIHPKSQWMELNRGVVDEPLYYQVCSWLAVVRPGATKCIAKPTSRRILPLSRHPILDRRDQPPMEIIWNVMFSIHRTKVMWWQMQSLTCNESINGNQKWPTMGFQIRENLQRDGYDFPKSMLFSSSMEYPWFLQAFLWYDNALFMPTSYRVLFLYQRKPSRRREHRETWRIMILEW